MRTLGTFEVCALRGHEPSRNGNLLARSVYRDSGSDECLRLTVELLGNCLNTHGSCCANYPVLSQLPTRVIDTAGANPRLIDSGGRKDKFAALSYCWGGDGNFKLTRATEQSFRDGRPLSEFPATLRDAITISKALDIRFIWIDALCIIQDCDQDWAHEASRMREVYRGAVVTIAAACASKASEGIFREREQSDQPRCWLDWIDGAPSTSKVFLRPGSELWDERMHQSVLNTRGWVLQETLLAPRTLWFGHQQLCFECPRGSIDEGGRFLRVTEMYRSKEYMQTLRMRILPTWKRRLLPLLRHLNLPTTSMFLWPSLTDIIKARDWETIRHRAIPARPLTLQGVFRHPGDPAMLSHFDYWVHIIGNYSSRNLTKPTDVLPALSGIASEFHRATGDTYVAGLWKMDIIRGLGWTRGGLRRKAAGGWTEPEPTLPEHYLGPSWSWMSILGKRVDFMITDHFDHVDPLAKVINIEIQPATNDPFGALKAASITLQAPVLTLESENITTAPPTSRYPKLMARLYSIFKYQGPSEFGQKHQGYPGQRFILLYLLKTRDALRDRVNKVGDE
ncbi:unnamed protein product [Clonostachys byssicola]|uniref:Heterokaryon incompatibility domain-containing protein n=1 Tax=Clonostachys byssicola TaxID=160290 RepID=A0A9N9Y779_9HYPO|nr:unnamed protein product [Clonostachys byssicola]